MGNRFISLDPGKTTGVAIWDNHKFGTYQISYQRTLKFILHHINTNDIVVCEDYITSHGAARMTPQPEAQIIVGFIKGLSEVSKTFSLYVQKPAMKYGCPKNKLKRVGWWTPNYPHANDAAAHLYVWASKHKEKHIYDSPIDSKPKTSRAM